MTPPPSIVEFRSVFFSYDRNPVLQDVTFSVPQGDFVSIVGPNGGGKTTLLKLMLGLLIPQSGSVTLFENAPKLQRNRVGYTPQFLQVDFCFPVSVLDVVLMGRMEDGVHKFRYTKADKLAAISALETMQLADVKNTSFRELSGGQRQRVLIARSLCSEPEMLLLDEPTSNIDPSSEEVLFDILEKLNQSLTIILVSHDIGFVSRLVKSVICVNRTVAVHPTSALNGNTIKELYNSGVRMIRHDHRCSEYGHE